MENGEIMLKPIKLLNRTMYNDCIKNIGRIDAILEQINTLKNIEYDNISEEDYDTYILQASSLLFEAAKVLSKAADGYVEDLEVYKRATMEQRVIPKGEIVAR